MKKILCLGLVLCLLCCGCSKENNSTESSNISVSSSTLSSDTVQKEADPMLFGKPLSEIDFSEMISQSVSSYSADTPEKEIIKNMWMGAPKMDSPQIDNSALSNYAFGMMTDWAFLKLEEGCNGKKLSDYFISHSEEHNDSEFAIVRDAESFYCHVPLKDFTEIMEYWYGENADIYNHLKNFERYEQDTDTITSKNLYSYNLGLYFVKSIVKTQNNVLKITVCTVEGASIPTSSEQYDIDEFLNACNYEKVTFSVKIFDDHWQYIESKYQRVKNTDNISDGEPNDNYNEYKKYIETAATTNLLSYEFSKGNYPTEYIDLLSAVDYDVLDGFEKKFNDYKCTLFKAEDVENQLMQKFDITTEEIRSLSEYNEEENAYPMRDGGGGRPGSWETIKAVKENENNFDIYYECWGNDDTVNDLSILAQQINETYLFGYSLDLEYLGFSLDSTGKLTVSKEGKIISNSNIIDYKN